MAMNAGWRFMNILCIRFPVCRRMEDPMWKQVISMGAANKFKMIGSIAWRRLAAACAKKLQNPKDKIVFAVAKSNMRTRYFKLGKSRREYINLMVKNIKPEAVFATTTHTIQTPDENNNTNRIAIFVNVPASVNRFEATNFCFT
jgi:hypothetical protein